MAKMVAPIGQTAPHTYSTDDLARSLQVCTRTVRRMADQGLIPGFVRVGSRLVRYRADIIDAWVKDGCPKPRGR